MSATTQDHANGWACVDCTMLLANGETPPELDEEETAAWLADIDRRTEGVRTVVLGRVLGEDGCECAAWDTEEHREGCESLTFSWSSCDVCGSSLGGAREAVTFWIEEA